MGGTSFDLSLVVDGEPTVSTETELEGLPVLMPLVDIHTIGAGGGSLAWLEAGGLRVGPQSAGAEPGPACYGRGGTQPTVTDANLVLGRLDPSYFLGGRMTLDDAAAVQALSTVACRGRTRRRPSSPRGCSRSSTRRWPMRCGRSPCEQGIDPREFALVAFGGAGPMHAVWLAEELEIGEVIVPWGPGTFSAWGMLQTDMRHDVVRSFYRPLAELDADRGRGGVRGARARRPRLSLEREGIAPDDRYFAALGRHALRRAGVHGQRRRSADDELARGDRRRVPRRPPRPLRARDPGAPVEFVNLRDRRAWGESARPSPRTAASADGSDPLLGRRGVVFGGVEHDDAGAPARPAAARARAYDGPVVIEEDSSTTVVPPGHRGADRRARQHADHERTANVTETATRPETGVVDPITTEIIRNAFVSCAQDMNATLIRSSYTPIIYEGKDCSVAILDENGERPRAVARAAAVPRQPRDLRQARRRDARLGGVPARRRLLHERLVHDRART